MPVLRLRRRLRLAHASLPPHAALNAAVITQRCGVLAGIEREVPSLQRPILAAPLRTSASGDEANRGHGSWRERLVLGGVPASNSRYDIDGVARPARAPIAPG